ncbi:MAG: hypothetical protein ACI8Q9_001822 [Planctomycetota bacterium]|jgi:uncharacterized protein YyaL (SSP411 family)
MLSLLLSLALAQPQDIPVESEHTNHLIGETSPYLLAHANNPVDWYPWGPEALELAKKLDKPIFLSIGYSACHWCHVMEEESFEDERIAALMNEKFVCIKVDREERPDLDEIYMTAVTALTGRGGWPMSVFLTPGLQPYYGGTYFPPSARGGHSGFDDVLTTMRDHWDNNREQVFELGKEITAHMEEVNRAGGKASLDVSVLNRSLAHIKSSFDPVWGGFGQAPKFPHTMDLRLALRHWSRTQDHTVLQMVTTTLDRMAEGGIYDQVGGGFARYSTDEKWLIPHFEKMLYDNALLVPVYLDAYLITGDETYARVARETCEWVLEEMMTDSGGFASSLDADSEGEEGLFYVWDKAELQAVLGDERGTWAAKWFGVTPTGNFEDGKSALWRHESASDVAKALGVEQERLEAAMGDSRDLLYRARETRIHPARDDKVLASWNGMMISALAQAGQVLGEPRYVDAASGAANYILQGMRQEDGRLFATARNGKAHLNGYLDDYAFVIAGLIDLYESDFNPKWIHQALALNQVVEIEFAAPDGGFYSTGDSHETLLLRLQSTTDGAIPAGLAIQTMNLLRLSELTGDPKLGVRANEALESSGVAAKESPTRFSQQLLVLDTLLAKPFEIVVAGELTSPSTQAMLTAIRSAYLPHRVVALVDGRTDFELMPVLKEKTNDGPARAFVCQDFTCQAPTESVPTMLELLGLKPK